jgi:hypothetical protein
VALSLSSIVQQVGNNTAAATTFTTVTPTFPGNDTAGNTALLYMVSDSTVATPSGWTLDRSQVSNDGHYAFRRATTGGVTNYGTVTITGSTSWVMLEVNGLDAAGLDIPATSGGGTTGSSTRSTGTLGTTTQADTMVIASWGKSVLSTSIVINSVTNSFTSLLRGGSTTKGSGINVDCWVYYNFPAATGAFETTATFSSSIATTGVIAAYRGAGAAAARAPYPSRIVSQAVNRAGVF